MYSYCNLIGAASSLALLISKDLDGDEINILGCFFNALGDNLAIIAASGQSTNIEKKEEPNLPSSSKNPSCT